MEGTISRDQAAPQAAFNYVFPPSCCRGTRTPCLPKRPARLSFALACRVHEEMQEVDQLKESEAMQDPGQKGNDANRLLAGEDVLNGRVPQIEDWLDAWCDVTERMSCRKQERLNVKKHTKTYQKATNICQQIPPKLQNNP